MADPTEVGPRVAEGHWAWVYEVHPTQVGKAL